LKTLLIFFISFFVSSFLVAQQSAIHYTVKDGLPQMQCMKLFQDSKGYIWIATKGGLSKFDGINFQNYSEDDGLPNNYVIDIHEDSNGTLWVCSKKGLTSFNKGAFTFFDPVSNDLFSSFIIDKNDVLWAPVNANGKYKLIEFTKGVYKEHILDIPVGIINNLPFYSADDHSILISFIGDVAYKFDIEKNKLSAINASAAYFENQHMAFKYEFNGRKEISKSIIYRLSKNDTIIYQILRFCQYQDTFKRITFKR